MNAQYSVTGKVTASNTNEPVPNAEIWNKTTGKLTVADENGEFEVSSLKEGTYVFAVFSYEYQIVEREITINQNTEVNFQAFPTCPKPE